MNAETVADLNQRWHEQNLETKNQSHEHFPEEFPRAWDWIQTRSEQEILDEVPRYLHNKNAGRPKVGARAMQFLEEYLEQKRQDKEEKRNQRDQGLGGGKEGRSKKTERKTEKTKAKSKQKEQKTRGEGARQGRRRPSWKLEGYDSPIVNQRLRVAEKIKEAHLRDLKQRGKSRKQKATALINNKGGKAARRLQNLSKTNSQVS
jgi:hypothetical protein